jgi:hypothetical protein
MKIVIMLGLVVGVSATAGAQQSVGMPAPVTVHPRDVAKAREATAMKCLSMSAIATQAINSREEPRTFPSRTTRGGLGLGALDASEGMSRPPLEPQVLDDPRYDRSQRGTRSFRGAMGARFEQASSCTSVMPKPSAVPDSTARDQ